MNNIKKAAALLLALALILHFLSQRQRLKRPKQRFLSR